ncbi:MAG: prephenate dehydratase [archaeon]|nr:prephenate dehydratase [archaeon]
MKVLQTAERETSRTYSVAFQGEIGAYSQSSVYAFFGKDRVKRVIPLPTFSQVFNSLFSAQGEKGSDFAVVPIENSLAGSVGETLDLLLTRDVRIIGEVSIPIEHVLAIHEDTSIDQIRSVISHPQAIAQCKMYLDSKDWQQVAVYDTAGAAKMIRDGNLKDTAAIASEVAAEIYGLKVVERCIEDDHSNRTRFIVIEAKKTEKSVTGEDLRRSDEEKESNDNNYKTSVLFLTAHKPGSLVGALSAFSTRGINLTKIESRPMKSRPWEYYFFVDFEGREEDINCKDALEELRSKTIEIKILGSYKRRI